MASENQNQFVRQTAHLCTVSQILSGEYIRREGFEPSFMATDIGMLSRVRLAGIVVEASPSVLHIDDGTGKIMLRTFDQVLPDVAIGTPLLVIGRPRVYNDEKYLLVEVCNPLPSSAWLTYYQENREEFQKLIPPVPAGAVGHQQVVVDENDSDEEEGDDIVEETPKPVAANGSVNKAEQIIEIIRELDPDDGAVVDDVLAKAPFDDAESVLQSLLEMGEVFELRAGKVKVLE